jgi:hypothetical protein
MGIGLSKTPPRIQPWIVSEEGYARLRCSPSRDCRKGRCIASLGMAFVQRWRFIGRLSAPSLGPGVRLSAWPALVVPAHAVALYKSSRLVPPSTRRRDNAVTVHKAVKRPGKPPGRIRFYGSSVLCGTSRESRTRLDNSGNCLLRSVCALRTVGQAKRLPCPVMA